jgi:hypothetical protein
MTFEQFAAIVRDWQSRLTPEQARECAESLRRQPSPSGVHQRFARRDSVRRGAGRDRQGRACALVELRHKPVETIAAELTKRKVETPRGGGWHGRTVARLIDRLGLR